METAELDKRFNFHPATGQTEPMHERIRAAARVFAEAVCTETQQSREQSLALTAIEESMMWANAAIARNTAPTA